MGFAWRLWAEAGWASFSHFQQSSAESELWGIDQDPQEEVTVLARVILFWKPLSWEWTEGRMASTPISPAAPSWRLHVHNSCPWHHTACKQSKILSTLRYSDAHKYGAFERINMLLRGLLVTKHVIEYPGPVPKLSSWLSKQQATCCTKGWRQYVLFLS